MHLLARGVRVGRVCGRGERKWCEYFYGYNLHAMKLLTNGEIVFLQPQYTSYPINSSGETCPTVAISMLTHNSNVICISLSVVTHFLIYTEGLNIEFQWCTVLCQIFDFGS